jgi:hypothetical protein
MGRTRERRREAEEGDDELTANEGVARRRKERVTVVDTSESRRLVESHPPLRSFFRLARGIFHPNRVVGRIQAGVGRFRWVWAGVETSRGLNELIFSLDQYSTPDRVLHRGWALTPAIPGQNEQALSAPVLS